MEAQVEAVHNPGSRPISPNKRQVQVIATRAALLLAAERLCAEEGVAQVTNRQIVDAAGQANNAAVAYHFGGREDLIRAVVRSHQGPIEQIRDELVASIADSTKAREWIEALVRPLALHLDSLGCPTWYARFSAQLVSNPTFRHVIVSEALEAPSLHQTMAGLERCAPTMSRATAERRQRMCSQLMILGYSEQERMLSDTGGTADTWSDFADGLVDAMTGLWQAPSTESIGGIS